MLTVFAQTQARHQRAYSQTSDIKMAFDCPHCARSYSTKYNLKRHLEQQHNFGSDSSHEYDDSLNGAGSVNVDADDSSNESKSASSDVAASNDEAESDCHVDNNSTDTEDNNTYTHDDVCAILRYFRLQQENEFQKEE